MKKILLIAFLIFLNIISAQTEKGTFFISGQTELNFTSNTITYKNAGENTNSPKTNTFNISPSVGFFIIDNLAIKLDVKYERVYTKQQTLETYSSNVSGGYSIMNTKETQETFGIIPSVAYFFSKGRVKPYVNAGAGFANTKYKKNSVSANNDENATLSLKNKTNGFTWGATGGLAYFVSNSFSLDLGLGYSEYSFKQDDVKVKSGALNLNVGVSVFIK